MANVDEKNKLKYSTKKIEIVVICMCIYIFLNTQNLKKIFILFKKISLKKNRTNNGKFTSFKYTYNYIKIISIFSK